VPSLALLLGHKSHLLADLKDMEQQLAAHQPLERLLAKLGSGLSCSEAQVCFRILPGLRQAGGQVSQYIRQQLKMTTEKLALQQDLNAETTQRRSEALILMMMPFALAGILRQTDDLLYQGINNSPAGFLGMFLAYVMAMLAIILTLSALSFNPRTPTTLKIKNPSSRLHRLRLFRFIGNQLLGFYKNHLPESYGARLLQILHDEATLPGILLTGQLFFESKAIYCLVCILPGILFCLASPRLVFCLAAIPIAASLMQDQMIFSRVRKRQAEYQLDYPIFLNLVTSLLQAGLSLHIVMDIALASLCSGQTGLQSAVISESLRFDLLHIQKQLRIGMPADMILEKAAAQCTISEVQSALMLMVRYDRTGEPEILQLLQMQATACWSLRRNAMRKQLERQSMSLLLPMTLDLISVMITAVLPAVISMQGIY